MNLTLSITKMAGAEGVSRRNDLQFLTNNKFHSYQISLLQVLNDDDYDRHLQHSDNVNEMLHLSLLEYYNVIIYIIKNSHRYLEDNPVFQHDGVSPLK